MKKIIVILFTAQLLVQSFYGILFFRGHYVRTLFEDTAVLMLNFDTGEYQFFLSLTAEKGVEVSRFIFLDDRNIAVYTSDVSLGNRLNMNTGRFPAPNSNEFISNMETEENSQVGVIDNVFPGITMNVSNIDNPRNFVEDGLFYIHTSDQKVIDDLLHELYQNIYFVELWEVNEGAANIFTSLLGGFISIIQVIEFVAVTILLFLSILASLVQYSIGRLKSSSILLLHGYSISKIMEITILEILKPLIISGGLAYFIFMSFVTIMGYASFLGSMSLLFALFSIILIFLYIMIVNVFIQIYLYRLKSVQILKGKKPRLLIPFFTQLLKMISVASFLVFSLVAIDSLTELNQRREHLSNWEKAQNLHRTTLSSVAGASGFAHEVEVTIGLVELYQDLSKHNQGFIMNATNIDFLDLGLKPYYDMDSAPPMELSPHGYRIDISPNFLDINPIVAANGIDIQEQIIHDDNTLNILVPESLKYFEEEILDLYLEDFHFQKVGVANIYNDALRLPFNVTPIEDLSVHIIYVEDGQSYFSFSPDIRPESGNMIEDPIAVIYTGNVHPSFLFSQISHSFYFYADAVNVYDEIQPLLSEHGLISAIQRVESVFNRNGAIINELEEQFVRAIGMIAILLFANLAITYNITANYFEKNKFKLFLKGVFGYSVLKRNKYFIANFFVCGLFIATVISLFLGMKVFLATAFLLVIDVIFACLIEGRLMNKSFSEVMKGER